MTAAAAPRELGSRQPMLVVDPAEQALAHTTVGSLARLLDPGDVLVLNDAATLPASLPARTASGRPHELRLSGPPTDGTWPAVLLGPGDWRTDTDRRPAPDRLAPGDRLVVGDGIGATVVAIDPPGHRRLRILFDDPSPWAHLYAGGRPVQYAYARRPVTLDEVQTPLASRPWAVELPSASRPLRWETLIALRRRGVFLARLTHAAGLSATGDPELDAALPFPERYDLPTETAAAVEAARERGARVLAVGTSVVRALEGVFAGAGRLVPGEGTTDLVIGPGFVPRVVSGLLSGVHEPGTSHHAVLAAFAPAGLLARAHRHAVARDYLVHEFGDSTLVLPGAVASLGRPSPRSSAAAAREDAARLAV